MRVPADDQVRAAVCKHLRPGAFIVVRAEGSLLAPVGKDDDKIGRFFRARQIVLHRVERHKAVDHPGVPRRAAVEPVGVVEHRDADAVFLHDAKRLRVLLRVVDAERGNFGVVLAPIPAGIENAGFALVEAVICRTGDDGKSGLRQCVGNLHGRAEARVVGVERGVTHQNGLLIDAGKVVALHHGRNRSIKGREVVPAAGQLC